MQQYHKKCLYIILLIGVFNKNLGIFNNHSYTIKKQFQDTIKAIHFNKTATIISSSFPAVDSPYIVIFVPTDKVSNVEQYSYNNTVFLENLNLVNVDKKNIIFFKMMPITDDKKSTKKSYSELLAQFIEWLYSYNKNSTIILIGDRSGNSIINHATHLSSSTSSKKLHVHSIIELYPTLISNSITDKTFNTPLHTSYDDLFIIYSDYINGITTTKSNKNYPSNLNFTSYLLLKDNEQVTPEEIFSPFCAQHLIPALHQAQNLYRHHKNLVINWNTTNHNLNNIYFLKDLELTVGTSPTLHALPAITKERLMSKNIKNFLEKKSGSSLKTKLPLSERSKYFYKSLNSGINL